MTTLTELVKKYEAVIENGGDVETGVIAVVKGMFWTLVIAENIGRRNGKLAMIGETADSSEAVAHRLIDEVLNPPTTFEAMTGRRHT